jgi:hypothetical protein
MEDAGRYVRITTKDHDPDDVKTYLKKIEHGDTMIWARGDVYSVSTKGVTSVDFNPETRDIVITYIDGTQNQISQGQLTFGAEFPIAIKTVDGVSTIHLEDIVYDTNHNLKLNAEENTIGDGVSNTQLSGIGNQSSIDFQHIEGKYAEIGNNFIFAIGGGSDMRNRLNLFEISLDGIAIALKDVIAKIDISNPLHPEDLSSGNRDYRLSDIHRVLDVDWAFIGDRYAEVKDIELEYSQRPDGRKPYVIISIYR